MYRLEEMSDEREQMISAGKPYVGSCLIFSLAEYGSLFKILQDCEGIATFFLRSFFVINTNSQDNPIFVFVGILFFPSWKEAFRILVLS